MLLADFEAGEGGDGGDGDAVDTAREPAVVRPRNLE